MIHATRIHFVGIGGGGMSAIARVCLESGYRVSGSDQSSSPLATSLMDLGARVAVGHAAQNLGDAELVVTSSAVSPDNVEVRAARDRGLPVLKRADLLGALMSGRQGVAVAGTHGKTTVTGLTAFILDRAGLDPTFIVGGVLVDYGANARAGHGAPFVVEADEYDRMFLGLRPTVEVVTNVEHDHPDHYPTLESMQEAFQAFTDLLPANGLLVACADNANALRLAERTRAAGKAAATYGLKAGEWRAEAIQVNGAGGSDFLVVQNGQTLGLARNRLPGDHNVGNSLAALAAVAYFDVDFNTARNALAEYRGAGRRFEVKGEARGITVIDDYAHHPTEIRATLAAARKRFAGRPIWAMFQPHTYSRTRVLLSEFSAAFKDADHAIVTDIFRSREDPDPTVSAAEIVERMRHPDARHIPGLQNAADYLVANLKPGDVLLTLGAGDGDSVGMEVLRRLGGSG